MKISLTIQSYSYLILVGLAFFSLKPQLEASLPESLAIEVKNVLQWDTSSGQTYQLQKSTNANSWENIATAGVATGSQVSHEIETLDYGSEYRLEYKTNVIENNTVSFNEAFGGAEFDTNSNNHNILNFPNSAEDWAGWANIEPTNFYPLNFSQAGSITFTAHVPDGGDAHIFFRFEKNPYPDVDPHFNIGTQIWQDANGSSQPSSVNSAIKISGATPTDYTVNISPQGSNTFRNFIVYIIENDTEVVLENVKVWDDGTYPGDTVHQALSPETIAEISWPSINGVEYDVMESSDLVDWSDFGTDVQGDGSTKTITMTIDQASRFIRVIEPEYELLAPTNPSTKQTPSINDIILSWTPSDTPNVSGYRVYYGPIHNPLSETIDIDDPSKNSVKINDLTPGATYNFAVVAYSNNEETNKNDAQFSILLPESINYLPLFDDTTDKNPDLSFVTETGDALITYGADRGRGRHAREAGGNDSLYDIYLDSYWKGRAFHYQIIDRVGRSQWDDNPELKDTITINYTTAHPLVSADMRAWYLGQTVLSQYAHNYNAMGVDAVNGYVMPRGHRTVDGQYIDSDSDVKYTMTLKGNSRLGGPIQIGQRMEFELSVFGLPPTNKNRSNYYGTAFLYIVGEGLAPWYGVGHTLDSYPLPDSARLGGLTTHHVQYSAELQRGFKQMAYNLAPVNAQPFMDGRRLHHTNFTDGSHSEPDNELFTPHIGKTGDDYISNGCVDCHKNNGRAIPNNEHDLMTKSIVRVGIDSEASIHPDLGTVLQVNTTIPDIADTFATGPLYNEPSIIYVETTGFNSPYYNFYLDEDKTIPFNFVGTGESSLVAGQTYTFIGLNTGHPFDMYYADSNNVKTYLVDDLTASGENQSFTINANIDYSSYTFTYKCDAHPHHMTGSFNLVNASNAEKTAYRKDYTEISGSYGNGDPYTLRKPNYNFGGKAPEYYSVRSAPQLVGLGLLEAIDEETIIDFADPDDDNNDKISGRVSLILDPNEDIRLGRFGYKASKSRLRDHIASALNTDMGITTSIYPTIDFKTQETSQEINDAELDLMYRYVALLALMPQRDFNDSDVIAGKALFTQANCVACHVETIQTGDHHPLAELRDQTIHPYTDLLLHDMGEGLADNMGEGIATGSEWRTAPLWNIGYTEYVSGGEAYLHDGRARTLEEAILWHGGEAHDSKEAFRTMSESDRDKLITFLKSL